MALNFIFGEGQKARTPEDLKRLRATMEAIRGRSYAPRNVGEGLSAIGDALAYRRDMADLERGESASASAQKANMSEIAGLLGGTGYGGGGIPAGATSAEGGSGSYRDAIAGIESGGRYDAVGPTHSKLGRALGKYQVMEANIGPWSEKHLGRRISAEEFLANPALQDAIFDGEFGSYVSKYGPEKAAQAWFGGEGGIGKVNRTDSLGTSIGSYGKKFMSALGQNGGAPAPVQTASLDPSAGMPAMQPPNSANSPSMSPNQRIAQAFAPVQAETVPPKVGPIPQNDQNQRILSALLSPQPMGGEFAGMQQPQTTAAIPAQPQPVAPQPSPEPFDGVQVAGVGGAAGRTAPLNAQGGQFPPAPGQAAQGAFPPAPAAPGQLDMNRLIELAADPNTPELGQFIVQSLLKQRMTPPDPMKDLQRQKTELEIQKSQRDLNPPAPRPMTPEERVQWGIPADDPRPFAMTPKGPELIGGSGTTVNVNSGPNSSKFVEESDKAAAGRMDEIVKAGQSAPQTMADMQQLLDLGAVIGTGKGAQVLSVIGPYAQAMGVNIDGMNEIQAYEAITSRLAPQMRAVGSGSSSDRDVTMFLQSLPNIRNLQGGNEIIANTMKAVAQNKINASEIASRAQRGEITWQQADSEIAKLPNPYELFKQFQKGTKAGTDRAIEEMSDEELRELAK